MPEDVSHAGETQSAAKEAVELDAEVMDLLGIGGE
jgi:hypothetical protein